MKKTFSEKTVNIVTRVSSGLFWAGSALGVFALIRIWLLRRDLPADVCPIDPYRPLLFVALGILVASLLLDVVFRKKPPIKDEESSITKSEP